MLLSYSFILKNKNFVYLWISQILSQITVNVLNFLLLIRLFEKTSSTIATSFLWISYALPAIVIGPFASSLSDIFDKRKILIYSNILQALVICLFFIVFRSSVFLIYFVVFMYSLFNQFYIPTEASTLPFVVEKKNLAAANSVFFLTQQVSVVVGFALLSPLIRFLGFSKVIFFCIISLLTASISVSFLPQLRVERSSGKFKPSSLLLKSFKKIVEGYGYITEEKMILLPVLLLVFTQVILTVILVNAPLLARELFDISLNHIGIFLITPSFLGAITSSLFIPRLILRGVRKKTIVNWSLVLVAINSFLLGFLIPEVLKIKYLLIFLSLFMAGFGFVSIIITTQTFIQENTNERFRARVFGTYWFLLTIVSVLPVIFSGVISEILGVKFLFLAIFISFLTILIFIEKYSQNLIK